MRRWKIKTVRLFIVMNQKSISQAVNGSMSEKKNRMESTTRCKHSSTVLGSYVAAHSTCLSLLLLQERKRGMKICLPLLLHIIE